MHRATAKWFGFNPPFIGGVHGVLSRQEDERLIKNDILSLIMTLPGERVHRPDFGTRIRAFTFENYDDEDMSSLRQEILRQLDVYESRVVVNRVEVTPDEVNQALNVLVDVSPVHRPQSNFLVEARLGRRN